MPTIVLGKVAQQDGKHLVDGQQRITNLMSFLKGEYAWNAGESSENKFFEDMDEYKVLTFSFKS